MASTMYFYIHKYFFLTASLFQSYYPVKYSDNLIPIIMWGYSPLWPTSLQKPPSAFSLLFLASWIQSQCRYLELFLTCNCIFKLLEDSHLSSPWIPMWFVSPPYWCCLPAASLPHPHTCFSPPTWSTILAFCYMFCSISTERLCVTASFCLEKLLPAYLIQGWFYLQVLPLDFIFGDWISWLLILVDLSN